jgi:hypothetical protein
VSSAFSERSTSQTQIFFFGETEINPKMDPGVKSEWVFITEAERDGILCAGPYVGACPWEEANPKAREQGEYG